MSITSNGPEDESVVISVRPLNMVSVPVFQQRLEGECNPITYWINSQGTGVFIAIGVGALALLLCCCYCCCKLCCCCCCRKRKDPAPIVIIQNDHQMVPAQSKLPYTRARDLDDMA